MEIFYFCQPALSLFFVVIVVPVVFFVSLLFIFLFPPSLIYLKVELNYI